MSKRKKLIFHIGLGKTGTTSLQSFFWTNRGILEMQGVTYPNLGILSGAHHFLSPHKPKFLDTSLFIETKQWIPVAQGSSNDRILMSSELVSSSALDVARGFVDAVDKHFDLFLVIYLRRQDEAIVSSYNQSIKAGLSFNSFNRASHWLKKSFDYRERLRLWESLVGRSRMIVRPYERAQLIQGDVRRDFLHYALGIDMETQFKFEDERANASLPWTLLEFKRLINAVCSDSGGSVDFRSPIETIARSDLGHELRRLNVAPMSPSERCDLLHTFRDSNDFVAEYYLDRYDSGLFSEYRLDEYSDDRIAPSEVSEEIFERIYRHFSREWPDLAETLIEKSEHSRNSRNRVIATAANRLLEIADSAAPVS